MKTTNLNNLYGTGKNILAEGITLGEKHEPTEQMSLTQDQINLLIQEAEDVKACNEALKGTTPEQVIEFYLDYQQSRMQELNAVYPDNKQSKTIKDCYAYITDKARKLASGSSQYMAHHKVVFQWAIEYFTNTNIAKFEKTTPAKITTSPKEYKVDNSPEAQRKKYFDWEEAHKERVTTWQKQHQERIDKWTKEHQMEIFFNPDDCPELKATCPFDNEKNPYTLPKEQQVEEEKTTELINGEMVNTNTGEILDQTPVKEEEVEEDTSELNDTIGELTY